jgi:hypothetical protein
MLRQASSIWIVLGTLIESLDGCERKNTGTPMPERSKSSDDA